jgi:hypothetical protein
MSNPRYPIRMPHEKARLAFSFHPRRRLLQIGSKSVLRTPCVCEPSNAGWVRHPEASLLAACRVSWCHNSRIVDTRKICEQVEAADHPNPAMQKPITGLLPATNGGEQKLFFRSGSIT